MGGLFFTLLLFISSNFGLVESFNVARISNDIQTISPSGRFGLAKNSHLIPKTYTSASTTTSSWALRMGLFDFFKSRENDFIKLDETSAFGPGPAIVFYNIPDGILDEEIEDMIGDGITSSSTKNKVKFTRLYTSDLDSIGEDTVKDILGKVATGEPVVSRDQGNDIVGVGAKIPILYFSGVANADMMKTYNIIGKEIYEESGGTSNAACAKAVEPAMGKCFRQLLEEISGDHADAIQAS